MALAYSTMMNSPFPEKTVAKWEVYVAEVFRYSEESGKLHERTFWVHESLTRDQAMMKIMDGYARP
jgi:hypothetical protein